MQPSTAISYRNLNGCVSTPFHTYPSLFIVFPPYQIVPPSYYVDKKSQLSSFFSALRFTYTAIYGRTQHTASSTQLCLSCVLRLYDLKAKKAQSIQTNAALLTSFNFIACLTEQKANRPSPNAPLLLPTNERPFIILSC